MFSLKYFLAWCIPDVPYETKLALAKVCNVLFVNFNLYLIFKCEYLCMLLHNNRNTSVVKQERHTIRKFHAQREKEKLNEAAQLNTTK